MGFLLVLALKLCWLNPTENTDGTPLTDLVEIKIYKDGVLQTSYEAGEPGSEQCVIFRLPEGTYDYTATAVDADGNESAFSNQVSKTEERLGGPGGGDVLQGPSGGTVITGDNNG